MFLHFIFALVFALDCTASESIKLSIPDAPPPGTQVLGGSFQGYSMELASFVDLAGNLSSPNKLSFRMLQNLKDITGSPAHIRVGGTTANHAIWISKQKEAIIQNYAVAGADQPANVTLGPTYLESFKTFPKGTKYTVGLTFDSGTKGEDGTVKEAKSFYSYLGEDLFAFEVGNEFDVFPVDRNTSTWSIQKYVPEWLERTSAVARRVFWKKKSKRMFQAAAFVAPGTISNDLSWTAQNAFDFGIASSGAAKTYCTHQYFGAACGPVKPTLGGALMNRTAMHPWMQYHRAASALSTSRGVPYVIGETNSIACQGLEGVSDVFGAAVWPSTTHFTLRYRYSAWQGVQNGTTAPGPRPMYYGNLLVASALGGPDKQVVSIANTTSVAGYAIYSAGGGPKCAELERIVLVNMELFNSTAVPAQQRPSVDFELSPKLVKDNQLSVRRLTASGADVRHGIAFAGRQVDLDGRIRGHEVVEKVKRGIVTVMASEIVLISIKKD